MKTEFATDRVDIYRVLSDFNTALELAAESLRKLKAAKVLHGRFADVNGLKAGEMREEINQDAALHLADIARDGAFRFEKQRLALEKKLRGSGAKQRSKARPRRQAGRRSAAKAGYSSSGRKNGRQK